jgi:glyoxylate reductase
MKKVLVTGTSVATELLEPLRVEGFTVSNPTHLLSEDELIDELRNSTAYLLGGDEIATREALAQATELKVIAFLGVGYQSFIDTAAAKDLGIPVTYTPGTLNDSVAEFTIGQLINANRRLTQYTNTYRSGQRETEQKQRDLVSRPIGIVGLGAIGTKIAEILRFGFDATVRYYSRTRKEDEERRLGITYLPLDDLVSDCPTLIIMMPGNESTYGMFDEELIRKFQPQTILVDTARHGIVDPTALDYGLGTGAISVAVFDGFYDDPVGDSLLKKYGDDRLLVTGHIASLTSDARDRMAKMAVQSINNITKSGTDGYLIPE